MSKRTICWFLLIILSFSHAAVAKPYDISTVTVTQFNTEYPQLLADQQNFTNQLSPQAWQYIHNKPMRHKIRLSKTQRALVQDYLKWEKKWEAYAPIAQFRDDLVTMYTTTMQTQPAQPLIDESTLLSLTLINRTHVLRKEFNMSFIPIWQNFLINSHIRQRGFCYHWANDLLETIIPLPRQHFSVTWSESNPGTLSEHNVTTIFPKGKEYKDGLFFDPWRTGGHPFWRSPIKDPHFNWKKREEYGTY